MKIVNQHYGIAAWFDAHSRTVNQVVFDNFDVWVGGKECANINLTLSEVMKVGDFIKFHGARVEEIPRNPKRFIQDIATAAVTAKTLALLQNATIPPGVTTINRVEDISSRKLENFKTVVNYVNRLETSEEEQKILEELEIEKF